jgi:hypothetical protein
LADLQNQGDPTQRLSVSMPYSVMKLLEARAHSEGRSMSNLVAHLLEQGLQTDNRD